ncbi:phospholipase A and acyltransferase 4-like [Solea solea]|uniref:phospholipase A and acyltransferase 4-like n=1 Tax=Solea solea TaxID=90069 RepID=UPI00272DA534|nr:phospholipase A and acyltransferase 4-like [Solea solea]
MIPGDLIAIDRVVHKHWTVYIGEDEVVHLVPNYIRSSEGEVRRDKLSDVLNGDSYQVNNLLDDKYKPRDPDVIVKEAKKRIGPSKYDDVNYNCKHFATEMRYGKPESRQVGVMLTCPGCDSGIGTSSPRDCGMWRMKPLRSKEVKETFCP